MKRQHLWAFLWLRWRLLHNQMRRGGIVNLVLMLIFAALAVIISFAAFVGFFFVGILLAIVPPIVILYVWGGLILAFCAWWATGTLVELQRSDVLSLDKVLHFPISVRGAFTINYISSLFSFTLLLFAPSMLALAIGLAVSRGPALLLLLPALGAFLLMVTAVTYQFQGWLASLMANKRRRRTILVIVTACFILFCQLPSLVNLYQPWTDSDEGSEQAPPADAEEELHHELARFETPARIASMVLPIGWLALAAQGLAEGRYVIPLVATAGMALIGSLSLGRAYRTTVRLYTGYFSSRGAASPSRSATVTPAVIAPTGQVESSSPTLIERRLPFIPERAAAVAAAAFRSLLRAPEIKLAMLGQVLVLVIIGSANLSRTSRDLPELVRPLLGAGCMVFVLISMISIVGNQFGIDRNGFRAYVLSAAPRYEILLGKNLATAPLGLTLPAIALVVIEIVRPMRVDHFLGAIPQLVTMYLLFCMLGNWLAIYAPTRLRSGALRSANPRAVNFLLQFGFILVLPWSLTPAFVPLLMEFLLAYFGGLDSRFPTYLVLSLFECAVVVLLYRWCLELQGRALQAREISILEAVCVREE